MTKIESVLAKYQLLGPGYDQVGQVIPAGSDRLEEILVNLQRADVDGQTCDSRLLEVLANLVVGLWRPLRTQRRRFQGHWLQIMRLESLDANNGQYQKIQTILQTYFMDVPLTISFLCQQKQTSFCSVVASHRNPMS